MTLPPRLLLGDALRFAGGPGPPVACTGSRVAADLLRRLRPYAAGGFDAAPPGRDEVARVASILAEQDSPDYWFAASKDGYRWALGQKLCEGVLPSWHAGRCSCWQASWAAAPHPKSFALAPRL